MKWRGKRKYKKQVSSKYVIFRIFLLIILVIVGAWTIMDQYFLNKKTCSPPKSPQQLSAEYLKEEENKKFIYSLIPKAKLLNQKYKVLASIIISQASLESDFGRSKLASAHHNLFGIKEFGQGPAVEFKTMEFYDNHWIEIKDKFKVYPSNEASMEDHTMLLINGVDCNPSLYHGVLTANSYKEAAFALQQAGYATDPNYADKLIKLIEKYKLAQYDDI